MAKLVLNDIASGYASTSALNDNFALIETALENTLSRDGTTPNQMENSLDMNSNRIINLGQAISNSDALSYGQFLEIVQAEQNLTGIIPITWEFVSTGVASYTLPLASSNAIDMYIVSVNGLIVSPSDYVVSTSSQSISFLSTPPAIGAEIVVRLFGKIPEVTPDSIVIDGIRASTVFTIVGAEQVFNTTFTLTSTSTDVYLNGVKLVYPIDYIVTTNTVNLASPATAGDTLEVVSHSVILAASEDILAAQAAASASAASAADASASAATAAAAGAAAGAIAGGEGVAWLDKSSAYTASHAEGIFADTSAGSFTLTLPATPSVGQYVYVVDVTSSFSANPLTVARNGEYIMGLAEDMVVTTNNAAFKLLYSSAANGWRII